MIFMFRKANLRNVMPSQCSIYLKVKTMKIYLFINQSLYISLKIDDGAGNFNNGAENLMIEHFNSTMEQLHNKIL